MKRKDFIKLGSFLAGSATSLHLFPGNSSLGRLPVSNKQVDFIHDGLVLSATAYAELLLKLADEGKIKPDYYSNGGVVEELEQKFATLLGKESATWMPTGTLANHIAIRRMAGDHRRVIVQERSHVYNDTGDCAQTLSNLNLIPLGLNAVSFSVAEVEEVVNKTKLGRVETWIGAISVETPVRRQYDRMISFDDLKAITGFASANGIKTHLDGARLFVQAVHTAISPASYGGLFDTVYTSLWKCFNAPSGAVLAGSKTFTEKLFHERRMFGGGLPAAWPFAAVALYYADGFMEEYKSAWLKAEQLFNSLQQATPCKVTKYENGSHIVRLEIPNANLSRFKESLSKNNIELPDPDASGFTLKVNPSLNRISSGNLEDYFMEALKASMSLK